MTKGKRYISYLRVSTDKQGRSGLGLEAQRAAIASKLHGIEPLREFVEVESGKNNDRAQLSAALDACRRLGATLIIAKLDRLSRNLAFIANLMESRVDFLACDLPEANRLTLHIMAAMAEHEREMISQRTKDALQAAKARGQVLGNPGNLKRQAEGSRRGGDTMQIKADEFAKRLQGTIQELRTEGLSLGAIARRLNDAGELTARGKVAGWTAQAVKAVILRLA